MAGFDKIIGHEETIEHLRQSVAGGKVSHAYLIQGPEGSGKHIMADTFAQTLQCETGSDNACGECHSCVQAQSRNHPDIIYVTHEKPNLISVDEIREQLVNDILIKPYNGRYKIYIVPEAEKMNASAQNALLKTLEEPPEYAVILLLTTNASALLETIRSRCMLLNLKPVPAREVEKYLMQKLRVPDYQAALCTAFAQGSIGKAVMLATSENLAQIRACALDIAQNAGRMELTEIASFVKSITQYKISMNDFLEILAVWFRDVLYFKATREADRLVFRDQLQSIRERARTSSYEGLEEILNSIERAKERLEANVGFDLTMELLFLTIKEN